MLEPISNPVLAGFTALCQLGWSVVLMDPVLSVGPTWFLIATVLVLVKLLAFLR